MPANNLFSFVSFRRPESYLTPAYSFLAEDTSNQEQDTASQESTNEEESASREVTSDQEDSAGQEDSTSQQVSTIQRQDQLISEGAAKEKINIPEAPIFENLSKSAEALSKENFWDTKAWLVPKVIVPWKERGKRVPISLLKYGQGHPAIVKERAEVLNFLAAIAAAKAKSEIAIRWRAAMRVAIFLGQRAYFNPPPAILRLIYNGRGYRLAKRPASNAAKQPASMLSPRQQKLREIRLRMHAINEEKAKVRNVWAEINKKQLNKTRQKPVGTIKRWVRKFWPAMSQAQDEDKAIQYVQQSLKPIKPSAGQTDTENQNVLSSQMASFTKDAAISFDESEKAKLNSTNQIQALNTEKTTVIAKNTDVIKYLPEYERNLIEEQCQLARLANQFLYEELTSAPDVANVAQDAAQPAPIAPANNAAIRIAGIGDLITVQERLKRYLSGEIAHIENLVFGVKREREHVLKITEEQSVETFSLTDKEANKSLETSTRTELSTTATQTAKEMFGAKAGLTTSGQYGLTQVNTTFEGQYQNERSESNSIATNKVQEVIAKTEEKIKTTDSKMIRTTTTRASEERNTENYQTDKTKSEIFLWVEQEREVRLLHKGSRLFAEFFVPEPGADLRRPVAAVGSALPPPPFEISATELSESNWQAYTSYFGATGVEPPPSEYIQIPFGFVTSSEKGVGDGAFDTKLETISIPEGYIPARIKYSGNGGTPPDAVHWYFSLVVKR